MDKERRKKVLRYISAVVFVFTPCLLVAIQSALVKTNLWGGYPHNSDEFNYWRVLYSFSKNGLDFGSTCGDIGTDAKIGPLGEHGLSTLFAWCGSLLLGSVNAHTLFIWNIIILSLSLLVLYVLTKPSAIKCISVIMVILCNAVVQEQWYSHMMELPCMAIIIICIALEIVYRQNGKHIWFTLGIIAVIYASYMRICYVVLALPLMVTFWKKQECDKTKKMLSIVLYIVGFVSIRWSQSLYMKKAVSFLTDLNANDSLAYKIHLLLNNSYINLSRYFSFTSGNAAEVMQRYLQIVIIIILIIVSSTYYRKDRDFSIVCIVWAFTLILLIVAMIVLYDIADWRDVRTTMPYTIGIMVWMLLSIDDIKWLIVLLISTILLQGSSTCEVLKTNHPFDRYEESEFDEDWISQIENSKDILCLYNLWVDSRSMFLLYENIPSKVGILQTANYYDLEKENIAYIITSEQLYNDNYRLLDVSDRYGNIYINTKLVEKRHD